MTTSTEAGRAKHMPSPYWFEIDTNLIAGANARIEELNAENKRLREDLKHVRQWIDGESWHWSRHEPVVARIDAALALAEGR